MGAFLSKGEIEGGKVLQYILRREPKLLKRFGGTYHYMFIQEK
jgi:hypothetical protein